MVRPDRYQDLYRYELADQVDENASGHSMDRLIARSLDTVVVRLVLSSDVRPIAPIAEVYLPSATVQRAVQTRVMHG